MDRKVQDKSIRVDPKIHKKLNVLRAKKGITMKELIKRMYEVGSIKKES